MALVGDKAAALLNSVFGDTLSLLGLAAGHALLHCSAYKKAT